MSTFLELKDRVDSLLDDPSMVSFTGGFINQGVSEIAGGVISSLASIIIPPLPELFTIGTVSTSTTDAFVDMPDDFQRDLQLVVSSTGSEIDIAHSFIEFTETYPALDRSGNISEAVEHGKKFYYQGIPQVSEIISLHYYKKPVTMVDDTDEPDGIPEHLQMSLLSSFALWKAYDFLEDGVEGEIPNTLKFKNNFIEALQTLELTIPAYIRGLTLR